MRQHGAQGRSAVQAERLLPRRAAALERLHLQPAGGLRFDAAGQSQRGRGGLGGRGLRAQHPEQGAAGLGGQVQAAQVQAEVWVVAWVLVRPRVRARLHARLWVRCPMRAPW